MSLNTVQPQQKYGLIKKGGKSENGPSATRLKPSNVFMRDELDDDDDDGPIDIKKELIKRSLNTAGNKLDAAAAKALKDDPTIFDYDGSFDDLQSKKQSYINKSSLVSNDVPKSRYIGNLQAASKLREKEQDRIFERKLLKEREVEDKLYGDQPKYITAGYKEKLQESKKWEYEDKIMDEVEKRHDVRSQGMQGFYANLLTKNVALGSDIKSHAISAYTAGSERQEMVLDSGVVQTVVVENNKNDIDHRAENTTVGTAAAPPATAVGQKRPRSPSIERQQDTHSSSKSTNGSNVDSSTGRSSLPTGTATKTAEVVMSAKERYLARKKLADTAVGPS